MNHELHEGHEWEEGAVKTKHHLQQNHFSLFSIRGIRAIRGSFLPLFVFGLALLFIPVFNAEAVENLLLGQNMQGDSIGPHVEHFADTGRRLTIDDVTGAEYREKFRPPDRPTLNFGQTFQTAHWMKFTAENPTGKNVAWILEAEHALMDHIEVYEPAGDGKYKLHAGGDWLPFDRREIKYRKNAFPMNTPPGLHTIYVRMYAEYYGSMNCAMEAWSPAAFHEKNGRENLPFGAFYGVMVVMVLYNLFIYLSVRDRSYLYYIVYTAATAWGYFHINGLALQYFRPDPGLWNSFLASLTAYCWIVVAAVFFTRSFLRTKTETPRLDKALVALMAALAGIAAFFILESLIIPVVPSLTAWLMQIEYILMATFPFLFLATALQCLLRGSRTARFYLLAWSLYLIGHILFVGRDFGILPFTFITTYGWQVGSMADVILLSFALADRINILRGEKEKTETGMVELLTRSKEELEGKVAERTAELAESENRFKTLSASAHEAIFIHDNGVILDANRAASEMSGYSAVELIGKNALELLVTPESREMVKIRIASGSTESYEAVALKKDGSAYQVEIRGADIAFRGKNVRVAAIRDITPRKAAEAKLKEAKEMAEDATRLKDKFVALVSHDLRSPLAAIKVALNELHKDNAVGGDQRRLLGSMADSCGNLLEMINRLLDISRLRTGRLVPRKVRLDCRELADGVIATFGPAARQKGVSIHNDLPEGMRLFADRSLYKACIGNLVSNALKFTEKGGAIRIYAPEGTNNSIAVNDSGTGIDGEMLPLLFSPVSKTLGLGTDGETGTGLGLPWCKDVMDAHRGSIGVESIPGKGSTFTLAFPPERPVVLVVDDQDVHRAQVREYLAPLDVDMLEAENGAEALRLLKDASPAVVITDIHMPAMDGLRFMEEMRKLDAFRETPVIAMTSTGDIAGGDGGGAAEQALRAGASDFVRKPLGRDDLLPRVKRFIAP